MDETFNLATFKALLPTLSFQELSKFRTELEKEMDGRYYRMALNRNMPVHVDAADIENSPACNHVLMVRRIVSAVAKQNGKKVQQSGRQGEMVANFDPEKVYSLLDKLMKVEPATIEDFIAKKKHKKDVIIGCFIASLHKTGLLGNWPKSEIAKIASTEKLVTVQQDTFKKYMSPEDNDLDDLVKEYH